MEVAGGPMLRAVLRQLSTAAAIRTLPTPCRARGPGTSPRQVAPGSRLGFLEAAPAWGDGSVEAGLEVWDLDDGFTLPPPLLELSASDLAGDFELMDIDSLAASENMATPLQPQDRSPCSTENPVSNEILQQLLLERLGSQPPVLLPVCAAVLAGGRRFPHARSGTRGQAVKAGAPSGRCMRFRQQRRGPGIRHGSARGGKDNSRQQAPRGR